MIVATGRGSVTAIGEVWGGKQGERSEVTRQERLEVRGRVAAGESFEEAADAVRCA
jgi:hypothetical protein